MHNVGAIFRTCDGVGVNQIFLCGITATPPRKEIAKTALSSIKSVNWRYYKSTIRLVNYLKINKINIVALEQTCNSRDYRSFDYPKPMALIIGNEINGVNPKVLDLCHTHIEIPMFGDCKSLNVATATGIALYRAISNC